MSQKLCKKLNAIVVPWRNGSQVRKKMLEYKDIIEHQILWNTKMGSSLFWFENWTGLGALCFIIPPDFFCDESVQNVRDVVQENGWDEDRIRDLLLEDVADHILENLKPHITHEVLDKPYLKLQTR